LISDFVDDVELGSVMLDFGLGGDDGSAEVDVAYAAEAEGGDKTVAVVPFAANGREIDA
jgi:hypothetical protein